MISLDSTLLRLQRGDRQDAKCAKCAKTKSKVLPSPPSRARPPVGSVHTGVPVDCVEYRRGAGKYSKPDKRRYYLTARGSATESAALLDVCYRLKLLDEKDLKAGKERVSRIVSMLVKLARSCEDA